MKRLITSTSWPAFCRIVNDLLTWRKVGWLRRRGTRAPRPMRWQLEIESLERRLMPSTVNVALTSSAAPAVCGQSVTFSAAVTPVTSGDPTPTGTVGFYQGTTLLDTETLDGSGDASFTTNSLGVGSDTITAAYSGDSTFDPNSLDLAETVDPADTSVALTSSEAPSALGDTVTFTATVSATAPGAGTPTGTVTVYDGGTALGTGSLNGSGQATFATGGLDIADHTITAIYGGDGNFNGSTSGDLDQNVTTAATTSVVSTSPGSSVSGQAVTITAQVSAVHSALGVPTGTVDFYVDGDTTPDDSATLDSSGQATWTTSNLSVASHVITVSYGGDSTFQTSSGTAAQDVGQADVSVVVTPSSNAILPSSPVTLTAVVTVAAPGAGTPTGTVTFSLPDGTTVGTATLSGGTATLVVSGGFPATRSIRSDYNGDGNFRSRSAHDFNLIVGQPDAVAGTPGTGCNCGCPNQEGSADQNPPAAGGNVDVRAMVTSAPVRYSDGVVQIAATDLSSDGFGAPWGQTRSWTNGPGYAADSVNGVGWVDTQMPYLLQIDGTSTVAEISNGMTAQYFDLVSGSYQARNFDQTTLVYDSADGQYVMTDESGNQVRFYDFTSTWPSAQQGQFASLTDAGGNVTAVTAHDSAGHITEVQRASGSQVESWLYSYLPGTDPNAGLLDNVTLRRSSDSGSTWTVIGQVAYTYYDGTQTHGNLGDLWTASIEDPDGNVISEYYYRYYVPGEANGNVHELEFVFTPDSYARLVTALGTSLDGLSNTQVAPYASNAFQYDGSGRVTQEIAQGSGCSACSGGLGTFTFSYSASSNTPGYNSWAMQTIETMPDGNQNIVYTNAYGEVMLADYFDTTAETNAATFYEYDDQGRCILMAEPSAVTGFSRTYADLLDNISGNYADLSDASGLVTTYSYYTSTTATGTTAGGVAGYQEQVAIQQGELGTPIPQETWTYYQRTVSGVTVNPVATDTVYRNDDGTGAETTSYSYTWYSGTVRMQSMTVSLPVVSSGQNGPGTADDSTAYYDVYGNIIWTKDAAGYLTYAAYDPATGAVIKTINDVNISLTTEFSGLPSGWSTPTGGGLNLVTTFEVDGFGRTTKETDPNGNVTYAVYLDVAHEVRVYAGWNAGTGLPTGPTEVTREDASGSYTETFTMTATPHLTSGVPDGSETISGLQSLSRSYMNSAGQVVETDAYFSFVGMSYSTSAYLGTAGTNYYPTLQAYDHLGLPNRTVSPAGTITRTVYDGQGRVVSVWVGTNDTPATGYWSPSNSAGMTEIASYQYDNGGVGDGDLTAVIQYPGGSAAPHETDYFYDWRDRQVASKAGVESTEDSTTHRPITYVTYNNLNEATQVQQFDGDGVAIAFSGGVPVAPSSSLLRAQTVSAFDDQGRVYQTQQFDVDPFSGSVSSDALTTNYYYGPRGELIAQSDPGGLWTKTQYDGAGRPTIVYTTDGAAGTTYADAASVAGDNVLSQGETQYDANGNVILSIVRQRYDNETATGALGDPSTSPHARVSYVAMYYEAANREVASVNVGTNGGSTWTRPTSVPSRSDTVLVTSMTYSTAGWLDTTTDPRGLVTKDYYDALGRVIKTVDDYTGGSPSDTSDQTTEYGYDGDNNPTFVQVDLPGGAIQETLYVYGVSTATGSDVDSNDIVAAVEYPDPSTGAPSTSQETTDTVNALGQTTTSTDRNGNVHTYTYDVLGRQVSDTVTTLGSGVDGSVRRMDTAYDTAGNSYLFTSYSDTDGTTIVNQVMDVYNGLGQLVQEYQAHGGAVDTSTTPSVQYAYTEMAGGVNNSRLTSITYPNGRVIDYNYASGLDDSISRLTSISDISGVLEADTYLGLDTVVERDYPQAGIALTYIHQTGDSSAITDGGDRYTGLDRFGRVIDVNWIDTSTGTSVSRVQYAYDRDSNVLYANNLVDAVFSQLYTYDDFNQLASYAQGTLSASTTGGPLDAVASPTASQSWTTDAVGNWTSVTTNGTTQDRTANAQNEITSVSGATTPAYDANGNLTTDQNGQQYTYDAWNRLVEVKDASGTVLASYQYDALGRRIVESSGGTTTDLYFNSSWQMVEEQVGGVPTVQYVWSPTAVDTLVERDRDIDGDGSWAERFYALQDANHTVVGLVNTSGSVVERYAYSPYGQVSFLSASWGTLSSSAYAMLYLFQAGRYDTVSGLYNFRHRDLSPTLGRWLENDPVGFGGGDIDLYRFVANAPTGATDPTGLWRTYQEYLDWFDSQNQAGNAMSETQWNARYGPLSPPSYNPRPQYAETNAGPAPAPPPLTTPPPNDGQVNNLTHEQFLENEQTTRRCQLNQEYFELGFPTSVFVYMGGRIRSFRSNRDTAGTGWSSRNDKCSKQRLSRSSRSTATGAATAGQSSG